MLVGELLERIDASFISSIRFMPLASSAAYWNEGKATIVR